jgi:hypothetical protein
VLIGKNTNKAVSEVSDPDTRLYKYNYEDQANGALHFTIESVEKNTNMRFARTYFLTNLSKGYMRDTYFSQEEEFR